MPSQSRSVYLRRRLAVLGILIILVIVIVLVVRAIAGAGATGSPSGAGTSTATVTPRATATKVADGVDGDPCTTSMINVALTTDSSSYEAGTDPKFSMTIANTGDFDCVINTADWPQRFLVQSKSTSGWDTYWSSEDCLAQPTATTFLLKAGTPITTDPVTWNRVRSTDGVCGTDTVPADGASYHVRAFFGDAASKRKQILVY